MIDIRVNGATQQVAERTSIRDLLVALEIDPRRVAVEYNRDILAREEYESCCLKPGDQIEIVHFVGGGCGGRCSEN